MLTEPTRDSTWRSFARGEEYENALAAREKSERYWNVQGLMYDATHGGEDRQPSYSRYIQPPIDALS